jgi:hypothetical protein
MSLSKVVSEAMTGVVAAAADTGRSSFIMEAEVKIAVSFADVSLSFLRRIGDGRLRCISIFAMLRVVSREFCCSGVLLWNSIVGVIQVK